MQKFMHPIKRPKTLLFLLVFSAFVWGIWQHNPVDSQTAARDNLQNGNEMPNSNGNDTVADHRKFTRNANTIDYSGITFTPWDVEAASSQVQKREKKPYTIMIYMNGSDLESENGAATIDLIEILESGVSADYVNIIIFTGGTNRWQNNVIPENECMIWELANGQIYEITGVGMVNMGDPGTLASFIEFTMKNFPAEKNGLILWDHGGGSIAGYGHDEKFNNGNLTLLDMNYAFEMSMLADNQLEFLGFDSCLMATIEMAVVASDYAKYLVASEDLTPGDGWDYSFLAVLNNNPSIDGGMLGVAITDYFIEYYGVNPDVDLNMSVIHLSSVNRVMYAMGNLMNQCSQSLLADVESSFITLATKRNGTKTFGLGSPRDNESDMVDIGDMAYKLSDLFPNETADIFAALEESVIYNRNNSDVYLSGLSSYYIYGGKDTAKEALDTYASLNMDDNYTAYLYRFFNILSNNKTNTRNRSSNMDSYRDNLIRTDLTIWQPVDDKEGYFIMTALKNNIDTDEHETTTASLNVLWPEIDGQHVCMYEISSSGGHSLYAIPAALNGRDCDIIVLISEKYPDGKILGIRNEDGFIIQKGYDEIKDGDKISFYYQEKNFTVDKEEESSGWYRSDEFVVKGELKLDWSPINDNKAYYSLLLTDIQNNEHFTDLKEWQQAS